MGKFDKVAQDAFNSMQLGAGVLLKKFNPDTGEFRNEDIICATTGGINLSCVPTYNNFADDVDNAPPNLKEFTYLNGWECKMGLTSLSTSPEAIRLALGAADVVGSKIVPRRNVKLTDFSDVWWAGDRSDGGMAAARLINALSTGGFSLQTTKDGKGQVSIELTGHVSIKDQDTVPMEFYSAGPAASNPVTPTPTV